MSRRRGGPSCPPWYAEGLRFACTRCGDCCRGAPGYVWVTAREVERVARFLGMAPGGFRRQFVRRVGHRLSLKERDDGDCTFYREGCLIYPVRPSQCVTFPFWESNLHTPEDWERLAQHCPGVNCGPLHPEAEIRRRLRADRTAVAGREPAVPEVPESALAELGRLYQEVERELGRRPGPCELCGECCRFGPEVPTLYASLVEVALVVRWVGEPPAKVGGGACPYLREGRCRVHPVRPLGCRTFFCRDQHRDEHQALCERTLDQLKGLCRQAGVPWRYGPMLALLRTVAGGAEG